MAYIDVIIPVFNCKAYLKEAVKSILLQPYKNINILLIDDGSTDGSSELCDQIVEKAFGRVNVIHQKNHGVSYARNVGIEKILEDRPEGYITFLDADDFWFNNSITENVIQRIKSDRFDLIALGSVMSDESGKAFERPTMYPNKISDGGEKIIWSFLTPFASIFYRKDFIKVKKIRFYDGQKYSEDKVFLQQAAALSEKVLYLNILLYGYRKNRASAMEKQTLIPATEYYLPIINGWIKSDEFINNNLKEKNFTAGKTLAGIYFLDMIAEHCMQHRRISQVQAICEKHPHYNLFLDMKPENVNKKQFAEHNLYLNHPKLFEVKYNVIGVFKANARKIVYMNFFYRFYMKKRFPYKITDLPVVI